MQLLPGSRRSPLSGPGFSTASVNKRHLGLVGYLRIAREHGVSAFLAQLFRVSDCRDSYSPQCGGC